MKSNVPGFETLLTGLRSLSDVYVLYCRAVRFHSSVYRLTFIERTYFILNLKSYSYENEIAANGFNFDISGFINNH